MLVNRTAISAARCSQCRVSLLTAFASVAGVLLRPIPAPINTQRLLIPRRAFQAPPAVRVELLPQEKDSPDEEVFVENEDVPSHVGGASEASVPWYLQVEIPQRQISPLSDRQQLPELPPNPPTLLQPILEHISIELGLDELILFDLRKLDPPPALGANLFMIIASARSEKHLHVSADRLCRWLRTTHGLRPFADGLLGRNELKVKLRRKARRAKLLGSVGSSESSERDDGVRTGWVCVNIGTIEESTEDVVVPEGFVGFGSRGTGARVVVQMLTEEKREQLDLEGLWGGFLRRQERKEAEDLRLRQEYQQEKEVGRVPPMNERLISDISSVTTSSYQKFPMTVQAQSRGLHASARSYARGQGIQEQLNYLKSLPKEEAIEVLGRGPEDYDSTSFLASFYGSYPLFPSAEHWECRLDLHCYATKIRHGRYGTENLLNQFKEMRASGVNISEATSLKIFRTILFSDGPEAHDGLDATDADNEIRAVSSNSVARVCYVLEDMSLSGLNIVTEEIFMILLEAVARSPESRWKAALQQLSQIILQHRPNITNPQSHLRILQIYANTDDWLEFWRYWSGIARQGQPRSADHYTLMYHSVALTMHQSKCLEVLRTWIPEMQMEDPPVKLEGAVGEAVMECVRVAEPDIENVVARQGNGKGEMPRLWAQCLSGLGYLRSPRG